MSTLQARITTAASGSSISACNRCSTKREGHATTIITYWDHQTLVPPLDFVAALNLVAVAARQFVTTPLSHLSALRSPDDRIWRSSLASPIGGPHKARVAWLARAAATETIPKFSGRKRERRKLVWTYWELNGESVDRYDQRGDEGDRWDDPEVVWFWRLIFLAEIHIGLHSNAFIGREAWMMVG
jgi:hypothetical protein